MFLKLIAILLTAVAVLGGAIFLGVVLLLVLRFWIFGVIIVLFLAILGAIAQAAGLHIDFY